MKYFLFRKSHLLSIMTLLMVSFFAFGKPILASDMTVFAPDAAHQDHAVAMDDFHALSDNGPKVVSDADMPGGGHAMICCVEGEQPFVVPVSSFSQVAAGASYFSSVSMEENAFESCFLADHNPPSLGDIILSSKCLRE